MNDSPIDFVECPTCDGSGYMPVAWDGDELTIVTTNESCNTCLETGMVLRRRLCQECMQLLAECKCKAEGI